jgi:putative ABC transport system substrate-binding protein
MYSGHSNRREFISLLGGAAISPLTASAQPALKRPLIAWMTGVTRGTSSPYFGSFLKGMRDLNYIEGRDFDMIYRFSDGYADRLPIIAEEIVRAKPDVIVATAVDAVVAVRKYTSTIPIVSFALADAVHLGLIQSEARPGGNITGIQPYLQGLPAKQLELALEIVPHAKKIGLLTNLQDPKAPPQAQELQTAAQGLKRNVINADASRPEEIEDALQVISSAEADVVIVLQTSMLFSTRDQIATAALARKLPTVFGYEPHVVVGGLVSYGIDLIQCSYGVSNFVDKILHGAKPSDLPVEFPTKMLLAVNLKTARALGITISPMILSRADRVIE